MPSQEKLNLKHVVTKKQTVDKKAIADLLAVQQQYDANHRLEQSLSPIEFTTISAFQKKLCQLMKLKRKRKFYLLMMRILALRLK